MGVLVCGGESLLPVSFPSSPAWKLFVSTCLHRASKSACRSRTLRQHLLSFSAFSVFSVSSVFSFFFFFLSFSPELLLLSFGEEGVSNYKLLTTCSIPVNLPVVLVSETSVPSCFATTTPSVFAKSAESIANDADFTQTSKQQTVQTQPPHLLVQKIDVLFELVGQSVTQRTDWEAQGNEQSSSTFRFVARRETATVQFVDFLCKHSHNDPSTAAQTAVGADKITGKSKLLQEREGNKPLHFCSFFTAFFALVAGQMLLIVSAASGANE